MSKSVERFGTKSLAVARSPGALATRNSTRIFNGRSTPESVLSTKKTDEKILWLKTVPSEGGLADAPMLP